MAIKHPIGGRILATLWMFTSILLRSYFTASVTSALTDNPIDKIDDLKGETIVTVANTTASYYLSNIHSHIVEYKTIEEAYQALDEGEIKAIVYDAPVLRYYARKTGKEKVNIVGSVFA